MMAMANTPVARAFIVTASFRSARFVAEVTSVTLFVTFRRCLTPHIKGQSPVALKYPPRHFGAGKERNMGDSKRSEAFGTPRETDMSSDDAAELEQLRREAAVLREQLDHAVGSHGAARSARDVHQLEARIDSLAARNSKLMETLKEARQQLLALREEVDRLGQPPSGYGVLLAAHDDDTVDVFTSGRKMRLTCSPNIDLTSLKKGQTVRLNEALTVVEAGHFEAV